MDNDGILNTVKRVTWTVQCSTLVDVDDNEDAAQQVLDMFEQRPWGETGKCLATLESVAVLAIDDHRTAKMAVHDDAGS